MGQSTNGEISFGIAFEEDYEFPWNGEDIEDWWRNQNGFKHSFEIYDKDGNHIDGKEPAAELAEQYMEFYQEYMRRRDKAMELAVLRYPSLDKRFLSVSFHTDSAFVGVYDRNDKFVENIIIDGKDLDA